MPSTELCYVFSLSQKNGRRLSRRSNNIFIDRCLWLSSARDEYEYRRISSRQRAFLQYFICPRILNTWVFSQNLRESPLNTLPRLPVWPSWLTFVVPICHTLGWVTGIPFLDSKRLTIFLSMPLNVQFYNYVLLFLSAKKTCETRHVCALHFFGEHSLRLLYTSKWLENRYMSFGALAAAFRYLHYDDIAVPPASTDIAAASVLQKPRRMLPQIYP
jgi:hypothetical protein